jgi:5-methylcytosine-specific restriction endonuclease McrA
MMDYLRQEFEEHKRLCFDGDVYKFLARAGIRAIMWDKTDGRCWYCGQMMNPWRDFSIDHVIPVSENGTTDFDNLVPCCRRCNLLKSHKSMSEFRRLLSHHMHGIPSFTPRQMSYLEDKGIKLNIPHITFYFEKK